MTAVTTVREVLWDVAVLLNDSAPQFNRYGENELIDWLNDGQMAIAMLLPSANSRVVAMKMRPGTLQSIDTIATTDLKLEDGSTPSAAMRGIEVVDFMCNMGADGATPGPAIPPPTSRRLLDATNPNWHASTGKVVYEAVYDPKLPRNFLINPGAPASGAVWLRIGLNAQPTLIPNTGTPGAEIYAHSGSNATVISVSDEHRADLVNYVCARARMKDGTSASDPQVAMFATLFTNSLNAAVTAKTGTNPNLKTLPMAPAPIGAAA